jgi:GT2 family glycosyltransferase
MRRWLRKGSKKGSVQAFRDAGDAARDRGDWSAAVEHYRAYLAQNLDHFPIWVQLGHVTKEAGDPGGAEQAYRRALDLQPRDPDLLLNLGHLMKAVGRTDEAIEFYQRSAVTDPTGNAHRELSALGHGLPADPGEQGAPPIFVRRADPSPHLKGVLDVPPGSPDAIRALLVEGDRLLTWAEVRGQGRRRAFEFRLPPLVCDGRPHAFEVVVDDAVVARLATVTPFALTPGELLRDYAGGALRGRLSTAAAWRYAALGERLAQTPDAATVANLQVAHRFLVDGPTRVGLSVQYAPLSLPVAAEPRVTIVIPVHNKFDFTYRCLASLVLMPVDTSFEVVLVDDGSTDATRDIAGLVSGLRVVRHDEATGFVGACNAGAAAARGAYVLFLNNDTEVSPHWLDRLIEPFAVHDDVGLVGAKLIFGDGRLQEAGGLVWSDGSASNHGRLGNPRDSRFNYLRDVDYCSGACIVLPTALWRELDGFDPTFAPAYYEDTDLAFRVRAAGRRTLYQPLAEILHFEGVSNGQDLTQGMKRFQALHEPVFKERWQSAFASHGDPAIRGARDLERSYPRQAIVIDTEVPQPDRSAGHHAAIQEMRLLQSLGYRVTFLPLNLAWIGRYNDLLASLGIECVTAPFFLSADEYLASRAGEFDLAYITRYSVAAEMIGLVRTHNPGIPVVFNNADLHFLRAIRDAIDAGSDADRLADAAAVRDAELAVMEAADLTLSYNPVEHAVIQSHTMGRAKVALCPWVVEPRAEPPPFVERHGIAFLGGYRHPPNVRAVEFFVREVMPELRRRRPGISFHVYGSSVPESFAALAADDVVIEGFVDSVDQALDRARVFVAPLRSGAGIKGKVLEALASGIPSVLSPIAAEGTGVRDGWDALVAETPGEWADAIVALYDDAARWADVSVAGRALVAANYSFARARQILARGFEENGIPVGAGPTSRIMPPVVDW